MFSKMVGEELPPGLGFNVLLVTLTSLPLFRTGRRLKQLSCTLLQKGAVIKEQIRCETIKSNQQGLKRSVGIGKFLLRCCSIYPSLRFDYCWQE